MVIILILEWLANGQTSGKSLSGQKSFSAEKQKNYNPPLVLNNSNEWQASSPKAVVWQIFV